MVKTLMLELDEETFAKLVAIKEDLDLTWKQMLIDYPSKYDKRYRLFLAQIRVDELKKTIEEKDKKYT
ncbi:MAG: hypothetical protein QXO37_06940 [Candidatus Nitrosocaldaceae archaeon]